MTVALIILGALVGVGLLLWLLHKPEDRGASGSAELPHNEPSHGELPRDGATSRPSAQPSPDDDSGECCGMHMTCEKDSLLAAVSEKTEYYEDEELDRFAGKGADAYAPEEIEEFRDVLLTLRPDEIAPWARSLQLRGITLPAEVREELLMIVAEARAARDGKEANR